MVQILTYTNWNHVDTGVTVIRTRNSLIQNTWHICRYNSYIKKRPKCKRFPTSY